MAYLLTLRSQNSKTGCIPISISPKGTCPTSCPLRNNGCYSELSHLNLHWRNVTSGKKGVSWESFLKSIRLLAPGTLWRHNQAGDLPGVGDRINTGQLKRLVEANLGKRGFTYTHKPMGNVSNREVVKHANANGFVINLSANNLKEADALSELGIGPVVSLVSQDSVPRFKTPQGNTVLVCPAQRGFGTCKTCGLCADAGRKIIIGFKPHGSRRKLVEKLAIG